MNNRIMIVDDSVSMRALIKNILTKNGYIVTGEAENGAEAVTKYKQLKPSLVIMDVIMPVINGIESVKAIRSIDPSAKFIMCSAMGQQTIVLEAIQAGASDFIIKPFREDTIIQVIERVFASIKLVS